MNNGSVINLEGDVASAGIQGYSAYEVAVQNGFEGTEEEWVDSFLTPDGYLKIADVIDNIQSNRTDKPLSANQGKTLKTLIDENADGIVGNTNKIDEEILNRTNADSSLQTQISSLASGSPMAASSTSDMTDTSRIYVLTTDGNWYYYDGSSWVSGGVYQASVSSSEVSSLNDNMQNLYEKVSGTISSSDAYTIRKFMSYKFKKDLIYNIKIKFNDFTLRQGDYIAYSLFATLSNDTTSKRDTIQPDIRNASFTERTYQYYFKSNFDANYLYLYLGAENESTYDIDVTISKPFGDFIFNENNFYYDKTNLKIKPKSTIGNRIEQNITRLRTANSERDFIPFNFKAGVKYYITLKLNEYTKTGSASGVSLMVRTTSSTDYTTIVEEISGEIHNNNLLRRYDFEFDCTTNANYLYVYSVFANNTSFDVDVIIIESYEDFTFDEDDFEYDINNKKLKLSPKETYNYTYSGQKIDLSNKGFNCSLDMTITTPTSEGIQGMAIFNGKLFQCQHKGILNVYDFDNKNSTPLATCNLGSYNATDNHANCINFSNKYYNGNTIPLAYIVGGNSGDVMECNVENITLTESGGTYTMTSELIQKITLDQSGFENAGYVPYWGWPCWLVSPDNKYLYVHGAKYRTNGSMREYDDDNRYIVTKFHYPDLSDSEVTLTVDDVLEQFTTSYEIEVTQGGTIYNDKIYYSFGFGNSNYPARIGVWDLRNKSYVSMIELKDTPVATQEPEDLCVYNNKLYLMTGSKKLYELEF